MVLLGHIAGIPVEETLLSIIPVGAVGVGALVFAVRGRASRLRRLTRRRPTDDRVVGRKPGDE